MKKIWKFIIMFIIANSVKQSVCEAQISLDTIIPQTYTGLGHGFKAVQISSTETKWFFIDTVANTFSLYNMDFTPFMLNIAVPEPFTATPALYSVLYLSRALFDCDSSNIEYAYYCTTDRSRPFRILRTDGTILFQLDSANGPYFYGGVMGGAEEVRPIINTSSGARMFLQIYHQGDGPIYVYSLCGTLPVDVFDFTEMNQSYVQLFPNPSSSALTFKINPPDNMQEYELVIVDDNAKEIKREKVNPKNANYTIDLRDISSGTYFYTLCTKNKSYQSGKFIINK